MRNRTLALVATSLGFGVVQLDVSVVNVAIQPIGQDLGGSISGLQWVVDAYTVAFAALILSAGALGDRVGARRVFVGGFALFTLASVACGLAPTLGVLIASRTVQGIGAAVLVPCSLSLITHAYPDAGERGRAVGLWAAGASVALSLGPVVGGTLTDLLSWRAIFVINVPLGLLGIALTVRHATETTRSRDRAIDLPGQAAAVLTLVALAGATVEGGRVGFADPLVLGGYAVALAAAVGFVLIERARRSPMLPLSLFSSRPFSAASAIAVLINIAFYGLIFVLSLYFQQTRGYSPLLTGLAFLPMTAGVLPANLLSGRLCERVGTARVIGGSALLLVLALAGLLVVGDDTAYAVLVAQLVAIGAAIGLIVPAMTSVVLGAVDADRSGVAAGTLNTARQTGSVIGVALFASLAPDDLVRSVHLAVLVSIGLTLVVAPLATAGRRNASNLVQRHGRT